MPETYRLALRNATVRPDRRDALAELIRTLFNRRNHRYVGGQERMWLEAELVQTVRRASTIYREELSTPTRGPLPFALGYLRVQDDGSGDAARLEAVSDTVPATLAPEALARLLSEFVAPGATLVFPDRDAAWRIEGTDALTPVHPDEALTQ